MKQVVCWKVLFYMWNFLIKLVKEFYKKCPFWHHETRWQKKNTIIPLTTSKETTYESTSTAFVQPLFSKSGIKSYKRTIVSKLKLPKFVLFIKKQTVEPRDNEWTSVLQNMFNPSNKVLLFQSSFWYILLLVGWGNLFGTVYTKDFIV